MATPPNARPRRRRYLRALALTLLLLVLMVTSINCAAHYLVARTDARLARDPHTGVLPGAQELDLGPRDAPAAAILVHGFIGAADNFDGLPHAIADAGWRVRVMRLPGHGTSPLDFQRVTPQDLIDAVHDEVLAMRREHDVVVLIGHSMGGALSTLVAAKEPLDGLVLAAPYFGVTQRWFYLLPVETWVKVGGPFIKWLYKGDFFMQVNKPGVKHNITSYRWVGMKSTRTLIEIGRGARDPELLQQVTCPVLMIHSEIDVAADSDASRRAFEAIASEHKEALWLERSNHIIFWDYEADEVEAAILTFLASIHPTSVQGVQE
jgi:carboxylesterase